MRNGRFTRRLFLARTGVLGAAAGAGLVLPARADADLLPVDELVERLRPVLAELSRDTLNGLTAFVVPGPDAYSRAQGTPRTEPGGLDAHGTDFLMAAVDNFVPLPRQLVQPVLAALRTAMADLGIDLPGPLDDLLPSDVSALDDALRILLENDAAVPLSLVAALLLNLLATQVNPLSVHGLFVSPFARLSFDEKAAAFALMEGPEPNLVGVLDSELPEPLRDSVAGLLRFFAGGLLEFTAFGAYNEWAVFDNGGLTDRPVGWELTGYARVSDGWDDFIGYYQGRTEVPD